VNVNRNTSIMSQSVTNIIIGIEFVLIMFQDTNRCNPPTVNPTP